MFLKQVVTPGLSLNSYVIGDEQTKRCVVVDPPRHPTKCLMYAENGGFQVTDIIETHVHADYVSGAKELKNRLSGKSCTIHVSGMGGVQWIPAYADRIVYEGDKLVLGNVCLKALHTPGHTPEHIAWLCFDYQRSGEVPCSILTGDCLFVGSVGRPDLLGVHNVDSLAKQFYHTIFTVLAKLPDCIEVLPAHGAGTLCGNCVGDKPTTTLGYERSCNPYLQKKPLEEWVHFLQHGLTPAPPHFATIKALNLTMPPLLNTLKSGQWNDFELSQKDCFFVDLRTPEAFALAHFNNSINLPFTPSFYLWAGWFLPDHLPLVIIIDHPIKEGDVIDCLRVMGFDQPLSFITPNHPLYASQMQPSPSFAMLKAEELAHQLEHSSEIYVLDVRSPTEWQAGHIPHAHHVELPYLHQSLKKLPRHQTIVCVCKSGMRASLAASLLQKAGFSAVRNMQGGMQAWKNAHLPVAWP